MRMVVGLLNCEGKLELFPTSRFRDPGGQRWSWETSGDHCHYFDGLPTVVSAHAPVEI